MRSSYGPEKLLLASKKPQIIDLIAKSILMTEDDIRALQEKPDVIKGLLNIRRQHYQMDAQLRAEAIADAMMAAQKQI